MANTNAKFAINDGVASNAAEIAWPEATANWDPVAWVFVATASTGGTVLWYGALSGGSVTVASGVTLRLPTGTATITVA